MQKELIVKSNVVVEAGYELTTNEHRLILSAICQIPPQQELDAAEVYEITAQKFAEQYSLHPKTAYRELKDAINRLYERSIIIKTEGQQTVKVRWLSMIVYDHSNDSEHEKRVFLGFSPQILPYLTNLKASFTQYLLSDISGVSGSYTIRFYELIKQYQSIGKRDISILELRFMLNLQDKYPMFADFKKRVIDPALSEINEKTPLEVSYELKKSGKRITHITLKFKDKKIKDITSKNEEKQKRDKDTPDLFTGLTDKQAAFFASKLANDPAFQSNAQIGEEMPQFIERIKSELMSVGGFKNHITHLTRYGFKN
jgi:plasmid replication initiation protein